MSDVFAGRRRVPRPENDPNLSYAPGTTARAELKARLKQMAEETIDIPIIIGGKECRTSVTEKVVMPHKHGHVLGNFHKATEEHVRQAATAAVKARKEWSSWAFEDRAAVFLRAAELLTTTWRSTVVAATMLGQSKTAFQAEIDAASELVDFWRFNVAFAQELLSEQPDSTHSVWNQMEYRPLEGFIYAVSPFNFTAIGGNLAGAPAIMGNAVLWKPASTSMLSSYYVMRLLETAGLPPGVINFLPGDAVSISNTILDHPDLAGIHFTGSTGVFNSMWQKVGQNLGKYRGYPRLVGETGGKDFIVVHPSADPQEVAVAAVRGAFEFQGQKCSAASRMYVPKSRWNDIRDRMVAMMKEIKVGDVRDFRNFMGAVIDKKSFDKISGYIDDGKKNAKVIQGGGCKGDEGYFIEPTLVESTDPSYRLLCEEIFGPVLSVYAYDDAKWSETLELVDRTSPYALTGSVFAKDRAAIVEAMSALRNAAGNFYINDKPTGAVVGQQPFGGARASGTNDKAGSKMNLVRWVSARTVKETLVPPTDFKYPFMAEE
ncbi:MAG TPA: L-glutamate gamma-semialdehyde dehydrogenase [Vicinamibacterales bacterium]|nr:L-glutamate gamma-semialdehyde dehydrogenase [Vicinamibacterales bacterium]